MDKTYYLLNPGRLQRKDNTLFLCLHDEKGEPTGQKKVIPLQTTEQLYVMAQVNFNSEVMRLLGKAGVSVHFFDYYENYSGSFMPRPGLLSGRTHVHQAKHYLDAQQRINLAQCFVSGGTLNMIRVLKYRASRGVNLEGEILEIEKLKALIPHSTEISQLMGIEGSIRRIYYSCFDKIIQNFEMNGRGKQPPSNEVNALISFGNMKCYAECKRQLYHTGLDPTISFLHEPSDRRYSLCLDIAEIFKPIYVDRLVIKLLNTNTLQKKHFTKSLEGCMLSKAGVGIFDKHWDILMNKTVNIPNLSKNVSYRYLIRLECHKILKHILEGVTYKPFQATW